MSQNTNPLPAGSNHWLQPKVRANLLPLYSSVVTATGGNSPVTGYIAVIVMLLGPGNLIMFNESVKLLLSIYCFIAVNSSKTAVRRRRKMGSKLIGFRVADDLAEQIETRAAEEGISTSELLRKLVDEELYPSGKGEREAVELEGDAIEDIRQQVASLGGLVEHFGNHLKELADKVELAQVNEGLTKKMVEEELERVEREATDGHNQLAATINKNTAEVQKIIPLVQGGLNDLQSELTKLKSELAHKVSDLKAELQPLTGLPSNLEGVKLDVVRLSDRVATAERRATQQPTDKTETLELSDGKKHTFRVYKGRAGLIKPHKVSSDLILGDKYVDLHEPLN